LAPEQPGKCRWHVSENILLRKVIGSRKDEVTRDWRKVHNIYFVIFYSIIDVRNQDSVVGVVTGSGLDDRGVRVLVVVGSRIFSSACCPDWLWGPPNLLSKCVPGAPSPRVKRPGREADHLPPASAEVKKMWIYTSTPPYTFI
jgi:hypothetical protein